MKPQYIFLIICLALLLAGCSQAAPGTLSSTATDSPLTATETDVPPTPTTIPPTVTPELAILALPPDPQRVEFQAEDGASLVGYYYPSAVIPAPIIVLMHWDGGDQTDWLYVSMVSWLQNRDTDILIPTEAKVFDASYPFPPLSEGQSYGVFTFDFRGFGESPGEGSSSEWIMDAVAAYKTAASLPGVDPERVFGIGGNINVDGAVDATSPNGVLSPNRGDWLEKAYSDAVEMADDLGEPLWCGTAENNQQVIGSCSASQSEGETYSGFIFPTTWWSCTGGLQDQQ